MQSLQLELVGDPEPFLLSAMDPPSVDGVRSAVRRLGAVGAVQLAPRCAHPRASSITALGTVCAELPLDMSLTRLVLLARGLGGHQLLRAAVELAACVSSSRLWLKPQR